MPSSPFPNPPLDVNALLAPSTQAIVLQVMISALVSMRIRADLWPQEGALISCMTVVANLFASAINATIIPAIKSGWLPTAFGGWLTWAALYMYGVSRSVATFASGPLTLTNSGGGSYAIPAFGATFQNPVTLATYVNATDIALSPGPGTSAIITIQATAVGSASNSNPGDVTGLLTVLPGVTCSNAFPILGIDEQSDVSLQLECWNSIAANSPFGPAQSFGYAIQSAINPVSGLPVNINRFQISESSHTGNVIVYVASPSGPADPNDVTGCTTNIQAIARPPCVTFSVMSATPVADSDTLTVYVSATPGLDAASVHTAIATALATFYASPQGNPIGGKAAGALNGLFAAAKEGVCINAWPGVFDVVGANNLPLAPGQIASDNLSVVVRIV